MDQVIDNIGLSLVFKGVLFSAFVLSALVSFACALVLLLFRSSWSTVFQSSLVLLVLAYVAFLSGFLSGNSREGVVGDVAPLLLTGVAILFSISFLQSKISTIFASAMVLVFSTLFFQGLTLGAAVREGKKISDSNLTLEPQFCVFLC